MTFAATQMQLGIILLSKQLGWPKSSFKFFHKMLQKTQTNFLANPISGKERNKYYMIEGNGNPFQYSCLENAMDRGAWQTVVHGVKNRRTRLKRQRTHAPLICGIYNMAQMNLSTYRNRLTDVELWLPRGKEVGAAWTGSLGLEDTNYYMQNG